MSSVLIDSNILLDLFTQDPQWFSWSASALSHAAQTSRLVINPIVYAEVSIRFSRIEDLDDALPAHFLTREPVPYEAAFLAGKAFRAYLQRGGAKQSPLPDFFIGAHAAIAGYTLLTRDEARYTTYFPSLDLITPKTKREKPYLKM
jgi:predicted nucleic acid-binding protein